MDIICHVCCGPCSIMPALRLLELGYKPLLWFMNPNIHPLSEYLRRRETAGLCAAKLNLPIIYDDNWDIKKWLEKRISRPEYPDRCEGCIEERLIALAEFAKKNGFKYFTTSLLYSKYQPHDFIAATGEKYASAFNLQFVYRDFRQEWQQGIEISREWNLYRQPYCGCIFSEAERYAKKLAKTSKTSSAACTVMQAEIP